MHHSRTTTTYISEINRWTCVEVAPWVMRWESNVIERKERELSLWTHQGEAGAVTAAPRLAAWDATPDKSSMSMCPWLLPFEPGCVCSVAIADIGKCLVAKYVNGKVKERSVHFIPSADDWRKGITILILTWIALCSKVNFYAERNTASCIVLTDHDRGWPSSTGTSPRPNKCQDGVFVSSNNLTSVAIGFKLDLNLFLLDY